MKKTTLICLLYTLGLANITIAKRTSKRTKKVDHDMQPQGPLKRPNCNFFSFKPFSNPTLAVVEVNIKNKKKVNETFKLVLNCPTMKIIDEPKMSHTLVPGAKEVVMYQLVIDRREIHRTPEEIKHKCVMTKWTANSNTLAMCHFDISIWPYGLFDYPCNDFTKSQVKFTRNPGRNKVVVYNLQDNTTKPFGLYAVYTMNLTCSPALPLIEQIETLNRVKKGRPWNIEVPANCSGVLRMNYVGTCQLLVYNLCHTQTTLAVNTSIQLYDGETDECEYLKERLGDLSQHPLAAFFGLNYVETGYLTVVILVELLVIALTFVAIFVRMKRNQLQLHK